MFVVIKPVALTYGLVVSRHRTRLVAETVVRKANHNQQVENQGRQDWYVLEINDTDAAGLRRDSVVALQTER